MKNLRSVLAASAIVTTTIALAGCSTLGIRIDSQQGVGVCYDTEAVTLSVTQNGAGDETTINYNGPSDVSLVAYQGIYSDSKFWNQVPTESMMFSYPIDSSLNTHAINVLDLESAAWTVTTSGDTISATFDGTVDEFIAELDYTNADENITYGYIDKGLPITVGVLCEAAFESIVVDSPSVTADGVLEDFELAIAQPLFPNFMYTEAPVVTRQTQLDNGISGKVLLPAEVAEALPEDIGAIGADIGVSFLGADDPFAPVTNDQPFTLADATLGDVWFLTLLGLYQSGDQLFQFTGDISLTEPTNFSFTSDPEPEEGYYLFTLLVGDVLENGDLLENPENFKVATSVFYYSAEEGLTFTALDEPIVFEKLAATGGDPNVIIWAVLGGLVVLAAVFLRPRRRDGQAELTIDPSDKKK